MPVLSSFRTISHRLLPSCTATILAFATSCPAATVTAKRAYACWDSIGINTHFNYIDTNPYTSANVHALKEAIGGLGLRHVRDGITNNINGAATHLKNLYDWYGIRTLAIVDTRTSSGALDYGQPLTDALSFLSGYASMLSATEGPNEYDGNKPSSETNWVTTLKDYQWNLFQRVNGTSSLKDKPVLLPSLITGHNADDMGNLEDRCDMGNLHSYTGDHPEASVSWYRDQERYRVPNKGIWSSESGWHTSTVNYYVPEGVQAKYTLRNHLEHFRLGIGRAYTYEIADIFKNSADQESNWGLLRNDLGRKPAYTALKNLITLIKDSNSTFTPGSLNYSLSGDTTDVRQVVLQKGSGMFILCLWLAKKSFDRSAGVVIDVPTRWLGLTVSTSHSSLAYVYPGATTSTTPIANGSTIGVDDEVLLIEVRR